MKFLNRFQWIIFTIGMHHFQGKWKIHLEMCKSAIKSYYNSCYLMGARVVIVVIKSATVVEVE